MYGLSEFDRVFNSIKDTNIISKSALSYRKINNELDLEHQFYLDWKESRSSNILSKSSKRPKWGSSLAILSSDKQIFVYLGHLYIITLKPKKDPSHKKCGKRCAVWSLFSLG